jgi:hypothetical protein
MQQYNSNNSKENRIENQIDGVRREIDHAPMILHLLNRVSPSHADGNPGLPIRRVLNAAN